VTADVNGWGPDLSGLDADEWEAQQLEEVMRELDEEGWDDELPEEGPWHDQAAQLADLNATLDASAASEQLRQSWDGVPLPRTSEERFAQALGRVAEGSYTPGVMYRPPEPSHGCGTLDAYGRCSARYHGAECMQADHHAAAAGGGEASEAWNAALLRNQETAEVLGVAREVMDELDAPEDPDGTWALREQLGLI
jgi:hypothetical protein